MRLALVTVPYTSSGHITGEARAPAALRKHGLLEALQQSGNDVHDDGDVTIAAPTPDRDPDSGIIAPQALAEMAFAVRTGVSRAIAARRLPFVVGGECPLLLGCLAAARDADGSVGLLFVDGHEDAWPPHQSTTGEAADMELGLAIGYSRVDGLDALAALLPLARPEATVLIGPRDREEIEAAGVSSLAGSIPLLSDVAVNKGNPEALGRMAAERVAAHGRWWLHIDLDVLASDALQAVRYPQPGGLTWDELEGLTKAAVSVGALAGIDLTIYNPDLDPDGVGADSIVQFVAFIGRQLAGLES